MGTTDNTAVQAATKTLHSTSDNEFTAPSGLSGAVGMGAANAPDDVMKVYIQTLSITFAIFPCFDMGST